MVPEGKTGQWAKGHPPSKGHHVCPLVIGECYPPVKGGLRAPRCVTPIRICIPLVIGECYPPVKGGLWAPRCVTPNQSHYHMADSVPAATEQLRRSPSCAMTSHLKFAAASWRTPRTTGVDGRIGATRPLRMAAEDCTELLVFLMHLIQQLFELKVGGQHIHTT